MATQDLSGRAAARARRDAQVYGKSALPAKGSSTSGTAGGGAAATSAPIPAPAPAPVARPVAASAGAATSNSCRAASLARRKAMSAQGKAGFQSADRLRTSDNKTAAAAKADESKGCGCGCNGEGRCKDEVTKQATAPAPSAAKPSLPVRPKDFSVSPSSSGRINSRLRRQALATHGKKGIDAVNNGVSSAQMARQQNPDISSRDLARSVRAQRATNGSTKTNTKCTPVRGARPRRTDEEITGTQVSHSTKTTGDEIGMCRAITGTDYMSDDVFNEFCSSGKSNVKAPSKVMSSALSRGGSITTASSVGRSTTVTGDEFGSCHNITGTEYVGSEQYEQFCGTNAPTSTAKVSFSQTTRGQIVSGSKPARARNMTGDEAGTCKPVTGTPYAGSEQYEEYCEPNQSQLAQARTQIRRGNAGRDITGIQPGLSNLTGAQKGICEPVTGTAYVGASQNAEACGAAPAQQGESDFPKPLAGAPWGQFSVVPPSHASQPTADATGVTGSQYEGGHISGTFSLGEGKVTGTEEARFGGPGNNALAGADACNEGRITGEGIDTGLKITGDDWDRNERVTGTEGRSAVKRNPTRRGPMSAMPGVAPKRNEEIPAADLNVTGSSGNTDTGALITVSGGARG